MYIYVIFIGNKPGRDGSITEAKILLSLLKWCAWAPSLCGETDTNYKDAVKLLETSEIWKQHQNSGVARHGPTRAWPGLDFPGPYQLRTVYIYIYI